MRISYEPNKNKILETLIFVSGHSPGKDIHHLLKVLYYADKLHLQKYGRPVTGDTYIKMNAGPVGSYAYDLLKQNNYLPENHLARINSALSIDRSGPYPVVHPRGGADIDYLSATDEECIKEAIKFCRDKNFHELCNETHLEKPWIKAELNKPMDYEDFIDDVSNNKEVLSYIRETSRTLSF